MIIMKTKVISLISLLLIFSMIQSNFSIGYSTTDRDFAINNYETKEIPSYNKVVFVTWDGVREKWFEELTADNTLGNASKVIQSGHLQKVRITTHITSTDPGLSTMETGYGDSIHGISANQFGPGSSKISIPDGLTTTERLKAAFGDNIKTGMFLPWSFHQINEEYMMQEGNYTDTIFANIKIGEDVDYWFASENLSWTPDDEESLKAIYEGYSNDNHGFHSDVGMFSDPLIKSSYLAEQITKFLDLYANDSFYIRTHFTEPDTVGHGYFESKDGVITPEYKTALIQCDEALGIILNKLEEEGILDDTLIIVGTDHGFYKESHDGEPWPNGKIEVTQQAFAINKNDIKTSQNIAIAQKDIAPTILSVLGVDISSLSPAYTGEDETGIPIWDKIDDDAPKLIKVQYKLETQYIPRDFKNGSKIKEQFDLYLQINEWSDIKAVSLKTEDDKMIEPSSTSNTQIIWEKLDRNVLGEGSHSLVITITDEFDLTTQITVNINAGGVSFSWFYSVIALSLVAIPILVKRYKK
ncbi:MAG: alkaline phosphatase family protein [Candidatus Heimdallarchaeaceae archaeon]